MWGKSGDMKRKEIKWNSKSHSIVLDIKNEVIILDGKKYSLNPVTNERLLCMCNENKVYSSPYYYKDEHVMYYCARKIVEGRSVRGKKYIDILVYNDALRTIGNDIYNRSIGHRNDVNEVEIHQVLSGKVLELIEYKGHRYLGIFEAGDYFEIPAGAFHCTYVLEDSTIVANIFGNVFWENNYLMKPYSVDKNEILVLKKDGKYLFKTDEGISVILDDYLENVKEAQCENYSNLNVDDLTISKKYGVKNTEDIFELFSRMTCEQ